MTDAMDKRTRIFCALDSADLETVRSLAQSIAGAVDGLKLGLEFFTAQGPDGVREVAKLGLPIFLDMKLHDIPNTVAGAIRSLAPLAPYYLTLHASGGEDMLRAARAMAHEEAARLSLAPPRLLAVTVLTSLDEGDLAQQGVAGSTREQVVRLAELARRAEIDGIVSSPREIEAIRAACGAGFDIVVPGIRPGGGGAQDQKRVMTPGEAVRAGASALVIGRPITGAADPALAAAQIRAEVDAA
ncbi:MAG: orotidine-5'-phosphate decarboxylase [Proteobacteria bacterium]|nr:orotidine-5'-phosphate decarboxylase [Pseudomonadota bacterium]MDA1357891.1 orotidine-5'-phosphate decarboxylase [Pseudomonadota bacterium]